MKRFPLLLIGCGAVLASGLIHGYWSGRWSSSRALEEALARVPEVPLRIGDWQGVDVPVDPAAFAQAGAKAYWMRSYEHVRTGETVSVILMCGPPGKLAVHTPDVCYQGAGYVEIGQPKKLSIALAAGAPAEIWTGAFTKDRNPVAGPLRLYWSWSTGDRWEAPDMPRLTFGGRPALFKLYLIRQAIHGAESPESGPVIDFLRQLLPRLDETLFPGSAP